MLHNHFFYLFCLFESMNIYIDEAGRGPLAGPLAIGLVNIIHPNKRDVLITDSKKLSHKQRDIAYDIIQDHIKAGNVQAAVVLISPESIDARGMTKSLREGIIQWIQNLLWSLDTNIKIKLIIDGHTDFGLRKATWYEVQTIIHGDALVPEIGMASILAKVERDRLMEVLDKKYPEYQFAQHKWYGTQLHRDLIAQYWPCEIHRKLFLKDYFPEQNRDFSEKKPKVAKRKDVSLKHPL